VGVDFTQMGALLLLKGRKAVLEVFLYLLAAYIIACGNGKHFWSKIFKIYIQSALIKNITDVGLLINNI
jgi:hypothetical protein